MKLETEELLLLMVISRLTMYPRCILEALSKPISNSQFEAHTFVMHLLNGDPLVLNYLSDSDDKLR